MSASITVRVPVTIRKRGGRRLAVAPDGAPWSRPRARIDNTLIKALAGTYRWKKMLDDGRYGSVTELAAGEAGSRLAREDFDADVAGAGYRRGDPGWAAAAPAGGPRASAGVSCGMG